MNAHLRTLEDLLDSTRSGTWQVDGTRWAVPRILPLLESLRHGYPIGCITIERSTAAGSRDRVVDGCGRLLSLAWALGCESTIAFDLDAGAFVDGITGPLCLPLADLRAAALLDFLRALDPATRCRHARAVNGVGKILFAEVPVYSVVHRAGEIASPAWSKDWPTEPGWYWARNGTRRPEPARVFVSGTGDSRHLVWFVSGSSAYPGERYWTELVWGPRIPGPPEPG